MMWPSSALAKRLTHSQADVGTSAGAVTPSERLQGKVSSATVLGADQQARQWQNTEDAARKQCLDGNCVHIPALRQLVAELIGAAGSTHTSPSEDQMRAVISCCHSTASPLAANKRPRLHGTSEVLDGLATCPFP